MRWAIRRPRFWITLILFVAPFAIISASSVFLPARSGPSRGPFYPPFDVALLLVSLLQFMMALFAGMSGFMLTIVSRSVIDIVYPAPLDRGAILRARVRRVLLATSVAVLLVGLIAGFLAAPLLQVPAWLFAFEVLVAFLPVTGFWLLVGALAAYGSSRASPRAQTVAALLVLIAVFVSARSLLTWDLGSLDKDAVFVLITRLSIAPTELLVGIPMNPPEALALVLNWVGFLAIAVTSLRWPYVLYEDSGTRGVPAHGGLTVERTPSPGLWRTIALRARVRYLDLGTGRAALLGRNLTVSLRGPSVMLQIMMVAMLTFLIVPLSLSRSSSFFRFGFPLILGGLMAGTLGTLTNVVQLERVREDTVRLLPLPPHDVYLSHLAPAVIWIAIWATLVALVEILGGAGPLLGFVVFVSVVAIGVWTTSWTFFATTITPPNAPLLDQTQRQSELSVGLVLVSVFVVMGELIPLTSFSGTLAAVTWLAWITGLNAVLAVLSALGGIAALQRPPKR